MMLPDTSIVVQDGASFAVFDEEKQPIIVWSVIDCDEEVKLIHFSFRPSGPTIEHRALAKYTARVKGGISEVLCGRFVFAEDFETKLKEVREN